uniref:Purine nucleoside phosphorylase n=1 Tax=Candidatus Kentrum sp. MB TaxID=2138164 RepID=A0A450X0Z0_9GAMM|nr:MAG: conserved hypothetical protein [Candidatus Kentron sp. MB]VFK26559.1 MAG: conserved hypothetical protein [Candidatus Kentron sp. MB]VFK74550.1 MAG: conserved hypothetical protein [Candidatus Kentron sp. MB]
MIVTQTMMTHPLRFLTPDWPAPANVRAYITTRQGGVSRSPWDGFNLADHVGDDPSAVAANRALLVEKLHLPTAPCWLHQVHGTTVIDADGSCPGLSGDASITQTPNRVCAVLTADCLPVLFCDRLGAEVGIAHAGWRGLAHGVLESTVCALQADPKDLLVWLGPGIGPGAFEVGDDVRDTFIQEHAAATRAFSPQAFSPRVCSPMGDRWLADLYLLARQRLQRLGVRAIHGGGFCTYRDRERFFSYRRDGVTGRMASVIYLLN